MSPERQRLAKAALVAVALLVVDVAGPRALEALAVSDRLFSGGAWGLVVAAVTVMLVCGRIAVYFIFPGYLLATLVFWDPTDTKRWAAPRSTSLACLERR